MNSKFVQPVFPVKMLYNRTRTTSSGQPEIQDKRLVA